MNLYICETRNATVSCFVHGMDIGVPSCVCFAVATVLYGVVGHPMMESSDDDRQLPVASCVSRRTYRRVVVRSSYVGRSLGPFSQRNRIIRFIRSHLAQRGHPFCVLFLCGIVGRCHITLPVVALSSSQHGFTTAQRQCGRRIEANSVGAGCRLFAPASRSVQPAGCLGFVVGTAAIGRSLPDQFSNVGSVMDGL